MDSPRGEPPTDSSGAAWSLWFTARARENRERAARAVAITVEFRVDGAPVPFYVVGDGETWAACGRVETERVVVSSGGVPYENLDLVTVVDADPYL